MVTPARVSDKYLLVGSCKLDGPLFPVSGLAAVGALRGLWLAITALPCKHTAAKVARLAALQFLKRAVPPNPSIEGTSKGYALGRPSCQTLSGCHPSFHFGSRFAALLRPLSQPSTSDAPRLFV